MTLFIKTLRRGHSVRLRVRVHRKRLQAGVTTVRVSSSRHGLRLGLGLATHHVKKLELQRLGLPPVARGRSRVTDRVTCRRQGALMLPRRMCDRKPEVPPKLVTSFTCSFPLITTHIYVLHICPITDVICITNISFFM